MQFPVYVPLGPLRLHPHWVFEALAYAIGFRVYLRLRRRRGDAIDGGARWWVVAAAAVGAALGSKLLYWFEDPRLTLSHLSDPFYLMAGKTIVGGLIGGLVAVEWAKKQLGLKRRTGDLFALPLCVGIAIGRIGCFLTGPQDHTSGTPTALPWGINFGDGVARHPVQLYEIGFLIVLAAVLWRWSLRRHAEGDLFKGFVAGYMGFRLLVDFLKPDVRVALGLSSIQWACVGILLYYSRDIWRWLAVRRAGGPAAIAGRAD